MNNNSEESQADRTSDCSVKSHDSDVIILNDKDSDGGSKEFSADSCAGEGSQEDEYIHLSDEDDCEIMWKNPDLLDSLVSAGYRNPRLLLTRLFKISPECLPAGPCEPKLWRILSSLFADRSFRKPLKQYHSLQSAIDLLNERSKILVLTGAGISVSCGIPDFRSRNGVYARLEQDFPDLRNPQDMFDMKFFMSNPNPFYTFAKELFPGQFKPSLTHRFIRLLEKKSKLLRNYTQNIDTLEEIAGISKIIHCHGSFATASCLTCHNQLPGEELREAIMSQHIPYCPHCRPDIGLKGIPAVLGKRNDPELEEGELPPLGLMKPDIVFFSESLPQVFHYTLEKDVRDVDLVLVMGSSLKVRPVSHIPISVPDHVPQILINREPLSSHKFDVELLGDCDVIVEYLCKKLGWNVDDYRGDGESAPEEATEMDSLKQVDLLIPMKAALEDLATQLDSSGSALASNSGESADQLVEEYSSSEDRQENHTIICTPETKKIIFCADANDTTTETKAQDEHTTNKVEVDEAKEIAVKAKDTCTEAPVVDNAVLVEETEENHGKPHSEGTAECPIDVDEEESESDWDEEDDDDDEQEAVGEESENGRIIRLAKYLPENTFTRIPRRLYVFKGSELAVSPGMVVEYVKEHSQGNDDDSNNRGTSECQISEDSSSDSSEDEDNNDDFISCVLQRCRADPFLEADRSRSLGEVVEVIDCDESPSATTDMAVTAADSKDLSNDKVQEAEEIPSTEFPSDGPRDVKRRKTNEDEEREEKSNNSPAEIIGTTLNSVTKGQ